MAKIDDALSTNNLAGRKTSLFGEMKNRVRKYKAYRRTYSELNALPLDSLLDLDLYRGDLKDVARRAVYHN